MAQTKGHQRVTLVVAHNGGIDFDTVAYIVSYYLNRLKRTEGLAK